MTNDNMDEQDFIELKEMLNHQDRRLKRIEIALLGDDEMGAKGLVQRYNITEAQVEENTTLLHDSFVSRFNDTEKRSRDNEKKLSRVYIYGTVAIAIIVFLVEAGIRFFT